MRLRISTRTFLLILLLLSMFLLYGCTQSGEKPPEQPAANAPPQVPSAKISDEAIQNAHKAVEKYEQAYKKNPENKMAKENLITAHLRVGYFYEQKREYNKAIDSYKKALAVDIDNKQVLRTLGKAQFQNGDQEGAISTLKRLCELNPTDYIGNYYLGQMYSARGDLMLANQHIEKALEQMPASLEANKALMLVVQKMGHVQEAKEIEEQIKEIKNKTFLPDRGQDEKLGKQWREQFEKNPKDYRALYNFAANQFNKIKHYAGMSYMELSIQDLHNIRKSVRGMNTYVKLTKGVGKERRYYDIMKKRKKMMSKLVEKRVHHLKAEYQRAGKPVPKEVLEIPSCDDIEELEKKTGIKGSDATEDHE